jgi:hypothetical protein
MLHLTFSSTLAEQHRDEPRGQADPGAWRSARADRRPGRYGSRHW